MGIHLFQVFGVLAVGTLAVAAGLFAGRLLWRRTPAPERVERVVTQTIAERVRSVGKLVGLEVFAKEIATASTGWGWMPALVLTQAKIAMIFHFEKQYVVDLSRVGPDDVIELAPGRFRLLLPPVEGSLRLVDVHPYDIQGMKVMGLVDLMPMTAERQSELMRRAQQQAAELFSVNDERYLNEARAAVERHVGALLALFGVEVSVGWRDRPGREALAALASRGPAPALPSSVLAGALPVDATRVERSTARP